VTYIRKFSWGGNSAAQSPRPRSLPADGTQAPHRREILGCKPCDRTSPDGAAPRVNVRNGSFTRTLSRASRGESGGSLISLVAEGFSQNWACRYLGVSPSTGSNWLRKYREHGHGGLIRKRP